jgi:hypothetical protein
LPTATRKLSLKPTIITLKYGETVTKIRVHFEEEKDGLKLIYEVNGVGIADNMKVTSSKRAMAKAQALGFS